MPMFMKRAHPFVVVTDDDLHLAQSEAARLSEMLWDVRGQLTLNLPDAAQAVQQAVISEKQPVIIVENGG